MARSNFTSKTTLPVIAVVILSSCTFLFDFDKPLSMPDGGATTCEGDEECDDDIECTERVCSDGFCVMAPDGDTRDMDDDGFVDEGCGGDDCNDDDRDVRPDQSESCNGIDDDCDGLVDDEVFGVGASSSGVLAPCGRPSLALSDTSVAVVCALEGAECQASLGADRCVAFGRLSLEGDLVSRAPLVGLSGQDESRPAVAFSDTESGYGVAWTDQRHVHFAFVGVDGTLGTGSPFRVTGPEPALREAPSIAWTGSRFAVAWSEEGGTAPAENRIFTAFVEASLSSASMDGTATEIASEGDATEPSVAAAVDGAAVAWTESDADDGSRINVALVSPAGETARLAALGTSRASSPALANQSRDSLVLAYRDVPEDQRAGEIFASIVSVVEGALESTPPLRVTTASGESGAPAVSISPAPQPTVGLIWHDERNGERQILLARLTPEGELVDADFPVSGEGGRADFPALVAVGSVQFLAAFVERESGGDAIATSSVGCLP